MKTDTQQKLHNSVFSVACYHHTVCQMELCCKGDYQTTVMMVVPTFKFPISLHQSGTVCLPTLVSVQRRAGPCYTPVCLLYLPLEGQVHQAAALAAVSVGLNGQLGFFHPKIIGDCITKSLYFNPSLVSLELYSHFDHGSIPNIFP